MTDNGFAPTKTMLAREFKRHYQAEAERIMKEEDKRLGDMQSCEC